MGNSAYGKSRGVVLMSRTLSWSPSVGQVWTLRDGSGYVEVVADHVHAGLVLVRAPGGDESWLPWSALHEEFVQACCECCGKPLDGMSWLLLQESKRKCLRFLSARGAARRWAWSRSVGRVRGVVRRCRRRVRVFVAWRRVVSRLMPRGRVR
jgi:hypothetical protein